MKKRFRGFRRIFAFTFVRHVKSRGYRNSTIAVALICLLLPALIMTGVQLAADGGPEDTAADAGTAWESAAGAENESAPAAGAEENTAGAETGENATGAEAGLAQVKRIFLADESEERLFEPEGLSAAYAALTGGELAITEADSFDAASERARDTDDALILYIRQKGREYSASIIVPDGSGLSEEAAYDLQAVFDQYALTLEDMASAEEDEAAAEEGETQAGGASGEDDADSLLEDSGSLKNVISIVFSYLNIMVLYFFVLIYGQSVATSIVTEKTSKLIETMLISVKPAAMILGKLLAITATGFIQLSAWLISLAAGFAAGTAAAKAIDPDTDMMIIEVFRTLKSISADMFTPLNCVMTLLLIAAGMLLYCALAGIGGALAGKTEDLSSCNVIFTLILVASFFAALLGGGLDMSGAAAGWLDWLPFTAVMITPARTLLGMVPVWKSLMCLVISAATTLLIAALAGKLYEAFVLYRGNRLGPAAAVRILRKNKKTRSA